MAKTIALFSLHLAVELDIEIPDTLTGEAILLAVQAAEECAQRAIAAETAARAMPGVIDCAYTPAGVISREHYDLAKAKAKDDLLSAVLAQAPTAGGMH